VLEPAERGVLHRLAVWSERIDFDHPAKAVRFVGVQVGAEAVVGGCPLIAEALFPDSVASVDEGLLLRNVVCCAFGLFPEVAAEVLFGRRVRVPRCVAIAAVVPGADWGRAIRVGVGLQEAVSTAGPVISAGVFT